MNLAKIIIVITALFVTAIAAMSGASAYSCTNGCSNYYYDQGNLGHGHLEVNNAGPVHSYIYPTIDRYSVSGLRPAHYTWAPQPQYYVAAPHPTYANFDYASSRYGHSMYWRGQYSGYSGGYSYPYAGGSGWFVN
ncbi:MAG: hypothetical protein ABIA93_04670 [Candidatus Woesearchaeota archaeon]